MVTYQARWQVRSGKRDGRCLKCSNQKRLRTEAYIAAGKKPCSGCGQTLPLSAFGSNGKRGFRCYCRPCDLERAKAWYQRNPAKAKARVIKWNHDNPERRTEIVRRRQAQKVTTSVEVVDYEAISKIDGGRCHICGEYVPRAERQFDHVIPLARGGAHVTENIRLAHALCNQRKGARLMEELA